MSFAAVVPFLSAFLSGAQTKYEIQAREQEKQNRYNAAVAEARAKSEAFLKWAELTQKQAIRLSGNARSALAEDYMAITNTERGIGMDAQLDKVQRARQGLRERATLSALQSTQGADPYSVTFHREKLASRIQEAMDMGIVETNAEMKLADQQFRRKQAVATAQDRINQAETMLDEVEARRLQASTVIMPEISSGPAWLNTLAIGMSAVGGFSSGQRLMIPTSGSKKGIPSQGASNSGPRGKNTSPVE